MTDEFDDFARSLQSQIYEETTEAYGPARLPEHQQIEQHTMMIRVAGGKEGPGKTTVATNLAVSLDSGVQLLDCDVEEPNAHLFIQSVIERTEFITTPVTEVDMEK